MVEIKIITSVGELRAEIIDRNPETAQAILDALPIEGNANVWGDEIYFDIPVVAEPENPEEIVEMGDIAYWPPGKAFCIFFGPTPASQNGEIRAASGVSVFAKSIGDPEILKKVKDGEKVRVELV